LNWSKKYRPKHKSSVGGKVSPLARTFSALFGTQAISRIVRFFYFIVIARVLGPELVGIYSYGVAFYISLEVFTNFGQGEFLAIRLSKRPFLAPQLISHSLTLRLITTILTVGAGLIFVWSHEDNLLIAWALTFFLAALVARSIAMWVRFCYVALEDALWIPRYELLFRGSEALIGTGLLLFDAGLLAVCCLHFLMWSLEAFFVFRLLLRRTGLKIQPGRRVRLLKKIARFSMVLMLSFGFLTLFSQVGVMTLKFLQPDTTIVGYFGVAMQFLTTILILPATFGTAVLPALGRVQRRGGLYEMAALTIVVKAAFLIGGIVAILSNAYASWFMTTILGPRFLSAAKTFAVLTWIIGPYAVVLIVGKALNALDARPQAATMAITMVIINVVAMIILIPLGGLPAAIVSLFVASLTGCTLGLVFLGSRIGFHKNTWWLYPMGVVAVFSLLLQFKVLLNLWTPPLIIGLFTFLVWKFRFFTKQEVEFILARIGIARQKNSY
jgi:O-antigen/teichoic acid export membrane protein